MSSQKIFTLSEIDVTKFNFSQPKTYNSRKSIYFYQAGSPLYFQTPLTFTPFGITSWDDTSRYSINISLNPQMVEKIQEIESRIIDEGLKESQLWFKKKLNNREIVNELFTSSIRWPKDNLTGEITDKYPPTLKLNIPMRDNNIACEGYRKITSTNEITPMEITKDVIYKGANIVAIIQCNSIWIAGGNKFGCTFKVVQLMRIDESPNVTQGFKQITGYAFIEDSDSE